LWLARVGPDGDRFDSATLSGNGENKSDLNGDRFVFDLPVDVASLSIYFDLFFRGHRVLSRDVCPDDIGLEQLLEASAVRVFDFRAYFKSASALCHSFSMSRLSAIKTFPNVVVHGGSTNR